MLIKVLGKAIKAILNPPSMSDQRVDDNMCTVETQCEQGDSAPTITRISDAPAIMKARDPMAKRNLINEKRMHRQITRHNTPGEVPAIQRVEPALILPESGPASAIRRSTRGSTNKSPVIIIPPYRMLGGGTQASARLISQQALNTMTM